MQAGGKDLPLPTPMVRTCLCVRAAWGSVKYAEILWRIASIIMIAIAQYNFFWF